MLLNIGITSSQIIDCRPATKHLISPIETKKSLYLQKKVVKLSLIPSSIYQPVSVLGLKIRLDGINHYQCVKAVARGVLQNRDS